MLLHLKQNQKGIRKFLYLRMLENGDSNLSYDFTPIWHHTIDYLNFCQFLLGSVTAPYSALVIVSFSVKGELPVCMQCYFKFIY